MSLPDDFQPIVTLDDGVVLGLGFDQAYWFDGTVTRVDRFVQLLERLDHNQRATLGLTPPRLAALTMLDELRGLYATGELELAKRLVDRVIQDLSETFGSTAYGEAKLMRPINPNLGRLAEHALAAFLRDAAEGLGRVRQLRTLAEPLSLERRRAAFTSIDPPGFEMIQLPVAVVHPTKWDEAAEKLGVSVGRAMSMLTEPNRGLVATDLFAKLGPELVRSIPRIPEDERPTLYIPPATWFAGTTTADEPLTEAYDALAARTTRFARLIELQAPPLIIDNEAFVFQRIVDRIAHAAMRPFDTTALDGWGVLDGPVHPRLPHTSDDGNRDPQPTCVWLTEDRVCVALQGISLILSISDDRVIQQFAIGGVQMQSCDERYIITTEHGMNWGERGVAGFGCYDTETGKFLDELPAHLPAVTFGFDEYDDGADDAGGGNLMDHRRGGWRTFAGDQQPTALAFARGNDAVLLYPRGVYSTRTMIHEVSDKVLAKLPSSVSRYTNDPGPCAVTRLGNRWRFLLPSGHICDVDKMHFDMNFRIDAAAFSPDGSRLLVVTEGEARIVDIAERQVVWRHMLA